MRSTWALLVTASLVGPPRATQAQPLSDRPIVHDPPRVQAERQYTLERCLELAERNYPKIHEALARLEHKRAQAREARVAPYSDFKMDAVFGLAPTVRGTSVFSPSHDVSLSEQMGLMWQVGIDGAIPIWTFGKITGLWSAADAQVAVGEHEVTKERNLARLSVRKAYYGLQLARDALALMKEATHRIGGYIDRIEEKVAEGEGDDVELVKLRMHAADLEAKESQARQEERSALASLRFLTGVTGAFDIPDEPLTKVRHTLGPLARYMAAARLFRPEINMARAGVLARRAQLGLEQSRFYPDLALGLSAKWAYAPEVTDQNNPYVRDSFNYFYYGALLAFRWKLDFLPKAARLAQTRADLAEMEATEQYALGGVGVEVEKAFVEARETEHRLDAMTRAAGYARQWLVKVQQGIEIGTYDDEDIVDPAKEYALKKFAQMSATFDFNLAIANLELATGWSDSKRQH
jgi:outer membrane protein TolC